VKLLVFLIGFAIVAIVRAVLSQHEEGAAPPLPRPQPRPEDGDERVLAILGPARHWFRDGVGQLKFGSYGGCVALTPTRLLFVSTGNDGIFEGRVDASSVVGVPVRALFSPGPIALSKPGSFAVALVDLAGVEAQKNRLRIRYRDGGAQRAMTILLERLFGGDEVERFAAAVGAAMERVDAAPSGAAAAP
jgi:hypothetical protein